MSNISDPNGNSYSADDHTPYRLIEEILARSVADTWHEAKREWELVDIFFAEDDELGTCLCGHFPIREHCVLRNRKNGNRVVVGNVCVTRFLGIPAEKLFAAFRRIMGDREAALNSETIGYAYGKGWIDDWKRNFYLSTCRKRNLSSSQMAKRVEINELVLRRARGGHNNA